MQYCIFEPLGGNYQHSVLDSVSTSTMQAGLGGDGVVLDST